MRLLSKADLKALAGKTCLLRINLDIKDPAKESLRIDAVVPTFDFLIERGAKILILSHRGRPITCLDPSFSLKPLIEILLAKINGRNKTSINWLENLRYDSREQANDESFARELTIRGNFFVNDDFATSHRACASLVAITKYLPSYAGLLLEKEVANLSKVMTNPEKPLVMIIGGAKIDDKVAMIENFKDKADYFLMGSAYSDLTNGLLKYPKVVMPTDWVEEDGKKLDVGPETVEKFLQILSQAKTVIWNGPLGLMSENPRYYEGSRKVADAIIESEAFSVVGGGETTQLLLELGLTNKFSFVSTGGGAMLEFLSGKKLPALQALEDNMV